MRVPTLELGIWIKESLMGYYNYCRLNAFLNLLRGTPFEKCSLKISHCDKLAIPLSYKAQTTNEELAPLPAKTCSLSIKNE
jgi:hypothetical protein